MSSRRVSLPVSLKTHLIPVSPILGSRLSPTAPLSPGRRSLPTTPQSNRRLPTTPRSPASPRPYSPRLPDLDERFPTSSSNSSTNTSPRHIQTKRLPCPRYQYSLRDSGYMDNKEEEDDQFTEPDVLRSFAYKNGSVTDNGYQKNGPKKAGRSKDSRRSTCPEIFLLPEVNASQPQKRIVLRIYGSKNSGKKTLSYRIYHHVTSVDQDEVVVLATENVPKDKNGRVITFALNSQEVQLEILQESALENSPFGANLIMYIVMYSIDNRDSFVEASQLLNRISQTITSPSNTPPVLLVANKLDLKRNQIVSSIEGKSLAKIYKCAFIEVSGLLSVNIDGLWKEIIRQVEHPAECSWVEKMVNRGKTFAKSCEEIVQKLIVT